MLRELWRGGKGRLKWSTVDSTHRFACDWRKMKRGGAYTVPFPASPRFQSMTYPIYRSDGSATGETFTASQVFDWRVRATGSTRGKRLFSAAGAGEPVRSDFQHFIRRSFRSLLVGDRDEIKALVAAMTPHSFRAGMASDLMRCGVPVKTIMKLGRWESERAMLQYVRDGLAQRLRSASFAPVKVWERTASAAVKSSRHKQSRRKRR